MFKELDCIRIPKKQLKVFCNKSYSNKPEKTFAIQEIAEFELGRTTKLVGRRREKNGNIRASIYFTIKKRNDEKYFLGEIYNDHQSKIQEFENGLTNFIKKNYQLPIIYANAKYQKRKNREILMFCSLLAFSLITFFASYALFLITLVKS